MPNTWGDNHVFGLYIENNNIYAGTRAGLAISTDNGISFINKNVNGPGYGNDINGIYVLNNIIYAATKEGFFVSTNSGTSFTEISLSTVSSKKSVLVDNGVIYVTTAWAGIYISRDGGTTWINKTKADSVYANNGSTAIDYYYNVFVSNGVVYVAASGGLFANLN